MKIKSKGYHISKVETTSNKIHGRGGLSLILRYLEKIKFYSLVETFLINFSSNKKGKPAEFIIRQIMAKMVDGTDSSITGFDRLKEDDSYGSVIEVEKKDLISSHTVKRFFRKFSGLKHIVLRKVLNELFVWRLTIQQPTVIILDIDTMVMNNDMAKKRHGVDVTYKKNKGFQPLQISWGNKIVDAIFRRGSAHSNHGTDVQKSLKRVVNLIRSRYKKDVPIIITSDSGFFDQKIFDYFEKTLKILYVCNGKLYDDIKKYVSGINEDEFQEYISNKNKWEYIEFGNKLKSWDTYRRAIFTNLAQENDQMLLEFARPDSIIYTNIGIDKNLTAQLIESGNSKYLEGTSIIELAHGRGISELNHRSFKEFIRKEQLPFKQFGMNGAYYYLQLITHFLYESYKEDTVYDVISIKSYPTTFRRKLIDFAVQIVDTGNQIIFKVTNALWKEINILKIWQRVNYPIPIF